MLHAVRLKTVQWQYQTHNACHSIVKFLDQLIDYGILIFDSNCQKMSNGKQDKILNFLFSKKVFFQLQFF